MSKPPFPIVKFEKSNEYEIDNFKLKISFNNELMSFEIEEKDLNPKEEYNIILNFKQLKKIDNYFAQFDSISEVNDSFEELINIKKLSIIKEENKLKLKIINPLLKNKFFFIDLLLKEKADPKIDLGNIKEYIDTLNEQIITMKNEYDKKIEILENKIKQFESILLINYDSKIIPKNEIYFINCELEKRFNGKINYTLIYRATKDGPKTSDFNSKCNGKNNQLIVLKTTKGIIFGGFTGRGFQNSNDKIIQDDTVFLFSFQRKKIYNIKKNAEALYEESSKGYGIVFGKCDGKNPIYLGWQNCDMLSNNSETCTKSNKEFKFSKDYELNDGEKYFNLTEIEVFQITKI